MVSKLQAQEQRLALRNDGDMEEAFLAMSKGKHKGKVKMDASSSRAKFPPCSTCKRTNHLAKDCWYKGKPQVQCTFCKKWGHREQYCRFKQSQQIQQPMEQEIQQPMQQANYTDDHVCDEHLFTMSQACIHMQTCSHYICPICSKSLGDMAVYFGMLDALLASEELPEEYRDRCQDILCNDCDKKGTARFHWLYHKCGSCGSYNTRVIRVDSTDTGCFTSNQ
ncbi:hypothetical protein LWI29_003413 [Acer saccharum]|uniref:RCHY1 zinc-ribbon domain-containing protein n=1 Tax=Acer saccharum TaxID=4024 RepID=A0AA39VCP2_ACESA|nr:hypothetical protein LWI29_003413 [Acer saccharum]